MNRYDDFRPDVEALLKDQEGRLGPADPRARSGDGLGALGGLASVARLYGFGALVHHLFAHTYRQALSPLRVHRYARYVRRGGRVAEYGCGTAPILDALARWYRHLNVHLVGADIPHLLFHFARWKFRDAPFVTMVPIAPNDDAPLPGRYATIFSVERLGQLRRRVPLPADTHPVTQT